MVTKATGNPPGRPPIALRNNPLRFAFALAEAIRRGLRISGNRARSLAVLYLYALRTDAEPSPRLGRLQARRGGEIVSFDISRLPGDRSETRDVSKRIQTVNTLEKMAKRGVAKEDMVYFDKLATCFFAALFSKASLVRRASGIERLSHEIGEEAHFVAVVAEMRVKVATDATANGPDLSPVEAASNL
jgi:hypothetical protein